MTARIAINGLGRIGRATLKIIMDAADLDLVAINDIAEADNLAYLLQYDTVYGRFDKPLEVADDGLVIAGKPCPLFHERSPEALPWKDHGVDIVLECTGMFRTAEDLQRHQAAGAKAVILSAPGKDASIPTIVHGVNRPDPAASILSCASCTTNCIAPVVEVVHRRIGIKKAIMSTVHGYTTSQGLVDGPADKWRRGRAAAVNLVPTSTGAAIATTKALPELEDRFHGVALRVPLVVGSIADIVILAERGTSAEEINRVFEEEAQTDRYRDVLGVTRDPVVSSDIIGDARASIVDLDLTEVVDGDLVKIMSWYDNEWGYAAQMVREARRMTAR